MISKNQIKFVHSLELKKNRRQLQLFVAEGPKVVGDLLKAGFRPHSIFSTHEYEGAQLVTEEELKKISFLQHPQGMLAVMKMPPERDATPIPRGLVLALDGVQDPGNLGTILRIADWFGIIDIYCSLDTADVYNPKVVQATMGSLAHVHVRYTDLVTLMSHYEGVVYGTLLDGDNIYHEKLSAEGIIVMGNEGNGISEEVKQLVNKRLFIPNFNCGNETAESLNVAIATAITCSEFRRRNL